MLDLKGKRILFIGTGFFDYENSIIMELKKRGAFVTYFSSVMMPFKYWLFLRLHLLDLAVKSLSSKITKLIQLQPKDIDLVFVVKGENLNSGHIDLLRRKYPNIPFVLYLWDSINRLPNRDVLLDSFSYIYTFDRLDSYKYGVLFRPLFCRVIEQEQMPIKYDISFVGSDHTIRYALLKKISNQLESAGLTYNFKLRIGRMKYFTSRYIIHTISSKTDKWFVTQSLDYEKYLKISRESNVVLDIANPMQSGLTIRTIESFGLGKRVITTNADLVNYGFDSNNFSIIDINSPVIDVDFVKKRTPSDVDMGYYSLEAFVDELFLSINY